MKTLLLTKLLTPLAKLVLIPFMAVLSLAGYSVLSPTNQLVGGYEITGGGTYRLQSSIGTTDTSITLSSFKEPISNILYTMSYLGTDISYGTLGPQSSVSEFISFTGITQNSDGTAALTGVTRGLSRSTPYTASTTLRQAHSGQSIFILSNTPQHFSEYARRRTAENILAVWTFGSTTPPKYDANVTATGNQLVSASQLNSTVLQGAATSSESVLGVVMLATQAQMKTGTASSTSGAPLVAISKYFGDTYRSASTSMAVMTNSSGVLDSNFIATSSNYTWAGLNTFSKPLNASSTLSVAGQLNVATATPNQLVNLAVGGGALIGGTTTVSTLAIASSTLQANGLTYQLPSSQSINSGLATTSLLVNDGNGGLSWGLSVSAGATTTNAGFTSTQVIAHGLGRVPALVEVKMVSTCDDNASNQNEPVVSFGYATSTGAQYYIYQNIKADAASPVSLEGSGTGSIVFANLLSGTGCISANLSDLNSTTFTINWGTNRGNTGNTTRRIIWKVQ